MFSVLENTFSKSPLITPGMNKYVVVQIHYWSHICYNKCDEVRDVNRNIVETEIENMVLGDPQDTIYMWSDFQDLGNYTAIRKALSRLVEDKLLRRLARGIYKKSHFSSLLNEEVEASPDEVARAIAKRNRWTIVPSGDTALNYLGLTTQVPASYHYASSGPTKETKLDNGIVLHFKNVPSKEIAGISPKSALVIEAIKTIGERGMNDRLRREIVNTLSGKEKESLVNEKTTSRAWIAMEIGKLLRT